MTIAPRYPRAAPWWSPWGAALRLRSTLRKPSDVVWCLRIGWFIVRLAPNVERTHLRDFLEVLANAPRPRASNPSSAAEHVIRLREPWLRLPGVRSHDTCYVRALTLYRFLDATGHDARLRIGAEWFDQPGGVLRGHAWVTVDGEMIDGPPELDDHSRLQLIELG
jgi:hypothetical protein